MSGISQSMTSHKIRSFKFPNGYIIAKKYEIVSLLGAGWEGEVYLTREVETGIERAAKFFFPDRNSKNESARRYATKLHSIRSCPLIIQYHNQEQFKFHGSDVTCLISDFVDGELLETFVNRQPSGVLHYFQALHILYEISRGLEVIHAMGEYHGDLHTSNIMIKQVGIGYQVKLIDVMDWQDSKKENIKKDVCDLIRIFYDLVGGQDQYWRLPQEIKRVCCGLKKSLILKKFKNASHLRKYLEEMFWH